MANTPRKDRSSDAKLVSRKHANRLLTGLVVAAALLAVLWYSYTFAQAIFIPLSKVSFVQFLSGLGLFLLGLTVTVSLLYLLGYLTENYVMPSSEE